MKLVTHRLTAVSIWVLFVGIECMATVSVSAAESRKPAACATNEYRQFDFWIGDWDAFDFGGSTPVARVRVDRVLDGCVLLEQYEDTSGLQGESFTIYDASRKIWHQSWVTNRGQLLVIEGNLQAGEMVLSGVDRTAGREQRRIHGDWKPVNGGVHETAVTSTDGGKTWKPWFDLMFRPAPITRNSANTSAAGDEKSDDKIIAALDTEYQAAVEKNDAATMDRILADDFVLVTGSGKTYSKADLLNEAQSGRIHYERQDDSAQKVRVWGNTAVVTAKLLARGTENGKPFEYTLWFSDTYVRIPAGWRYVFGQASLPLPKTSQQ